MVNMKSVLLHCCCAHCAAYTVDHWRHQGYEVSALWYNPNIHPYLEHQHRLEGMQSLAKEMKLPLIMTDGYDMMEYFRRVAGHETQRCQHCFDLRLSKTAETAHQWGGYWGYTTGR
ncbi:Epoxyqueuosine reductase QueH [subsurface metagenome]